MVQIIKGDIFESDTQTIVNTVNCVGVMGKGIALLFKEKYPKMFIRYKELCDLNLIKTGSLWLYKTSDKWILNFPTKDHWKNPSEIEYLKTGLKKFIDTYEEKGITSISFPLLGATNGGINPDISLRIMTEYLNDCKIPVIIFDNRK
jgi:O-acetyl-ADP-ribose deacetylase (regulator of RNase III)